MGVRAHREETPRRSEEDRRGRRRGKEKERKKEKRKKRGKKIDGWVQNARKLTPFSDACVTRNQSSPLLSPFRQRLAAGWSISRCPHFTLLFWGPPTPLQPPIHPQCHPRRALRQWLRPLLWIVSPISGHLFALSGTRLSVSAIMTSPKRLQFQDSVITENLNYLITSFFL